MTNEITQLCDHEVETIALAYTLAGFDIYEEWTIEEKEFFSKMSVQTGRTRAELSSAVYAYHRERTIQWPTQP